MGRRAIAPTSAEEMVAAILEARRNELGISQAELARMTNGALGQSSVDRYLKPGAQSMPIAAFLALCKALGLEPTEVLARAGID